MCGQIFDPLKASKNRGRGVFETTIGVGKVV